MPIKLTSHLVEFYGTECVICKKLEPLLDRLQDEVGIEIQKIEVWHNEENAKLWKQMDSGFCGAVPLFVNTKTNKKICGSATYEKFKEWALGK